jgi:probable F420-dependent oxidoreductase
VGRGRPQLISAVKVGLIPAAGGGISAAPAYISEYVETAEAVGFESVWMGEHPALPATSDTPYPGDGTGLGEPSRVPLPDPLEWLAYAAARTTTLLIGTAVLILPLHHPVVMAKRAATLDHISGGRLRLGVGVGWNRQEYAACGASWHGRGKRMDELIAAMRVLWADDVASFEGPTVQFEPVFSSPKPARGSVPVHIGATAPVGARRAGRLGDGYLPFERDLDQLAALIGEMKAAAETAGRDPESIEITTMGSTTPAKVRAMARLGVGRMLFFADDIAALPELAQRAGAAVSAI